MKIGDKVILLDCHDMKSDQFTWLNSLNKHVGKTFTVCEVIQRGIHVEEMGWFLARAWVELQNDILPEEMFEI